MGSARIHRSVCWGGCGRIKGTKKFLKGSPVLALTVTHPFDKYIFCEESDELACGAKGAREAARAAGAGGIHRMATVIPRSTRICKEIPKGHPANKVLASVWSTRLTLG